MKHRVYMRLLLPDSSAAGVRRERREGNTPRSGPNPRPRIDQVPAERDARGDGPGRAVGAHAGQQERAGHGQEADDRDQTLPESTARHAPHHAERSVAARRGRGHNRRTYMPVDQGRHFDGGGAGGVYGPPRIYYFSL